MPGPARWNDREQGRHRRANHEADKSQVSDYPIRRSGLSLYRKAGMTLSRNRAREAMASSWAMSPK